MSKSNAQGNATSVAKENVVVIAELGNEYGNIRVRTSNAGVNCVVVPKGRPDGTDAWVPVSIISAKLQSDAKTNRLILACEMKLADGIKGVRPKDFADNAVRSILGKMKVKLTYVPHSAGEIYVNESTGEQGTYEKDGYNLDTKTKGAFILSYGVKGSEGREAYEACDTSYFLDSDDESIGEF
jgi:hypothetical protein